VHDLAFRLRSHCPNPWQRSKAPAAGWIRPVINDRIFVEAKRIANETDEIQNPPQIYPQHVEHLCAACNGGERGQTTVHVGTAIAVIPTARVGRVTGWPLATAGTNRSTKARRVTGSESKRMSGPHEDHTYGPRSLRYDLTAQAVVAEWAHMEGNSGRQERGQADLDSPSSVNPEGRAHLRCWSKRDP
jgi:hypothetical protein